VAVGSWIDAFGGGAGEIGAAAAAVAERLLVRLLLLPRRLTVGSWIPILVLLLLLLLLVLWITASALQTVSPVSST
jgi:nitrate/nitrite transporter NarK